MHFEDLTPYQYGLDAPIASVKNIGWLERGHVYTRGACDPRVAATLHSYYARLKTNQTRGLHGCALCLIDDDPPLVVDGKQTWLGSAELWVPGPDGTTFAAPNMVIHYLRVHSYQPPEVFIDAVLALPDRIDGWDPERIRSSAARFTR